MVRSRFLFLLLLAYVSLTPVGVYTCACFVPGEPALPAPETLAQFSEQAPGGHTAVCTLLAYFSLTFLATAVVNLVTPWQKCRFCLRPCQEPAEFVLSPPTPPPHFA
jgi:hypothetical protein